MNLLSHLEAGLILVCGIALMAILFFLSIFYRYNKKILYLGSAIGLVCFFTFAYNVIIINFTDSMPKGIYKLQKENSYNKGDIIVFCPDEREPFRIARERLYFGDYGRCKESIPLIKRIIATQGDTITLKQEGVILNQHLLPHTQTKEKDSQGRELKQASFNNFKLGQNDFFVLNDHSNSFDSRYFGVIHKEMIVAKAKLIIGW
ncbi:hypothetical protein CCZ01_09455 [Helicobacter monodelphidis]|uniref:conjugative transfer signal peptidase TraF n=1 Tax=Helicobacter sp. 15-1451 TaxID=2004995 RepID=UPI000DCDED75|nr:conjugative transfer signal peptidase TraF [Helicobacter sp. 15-1451]RAX56453.1 hypothetical protein CCZ01_09455 [Helicobacter sp. 15-1451]